MAQLTFISETGMFHSACRCTWATGVEWYGFKPRAHRRPAGEGMIDRTDRSTFTNHSITFTVNDALLRSAVASVAAVYSAKTYVLAVCDCVSFTAEVARRVHLRVPLVNISPYGFIQILALWNKYDSKT